MWFLWNILDYVPIIGTVKNTGESVVAFYQGDSERGSIKAVEAAVGGALDIFTFGTGTVVAAVFKESGKTVAKVFAKEVTKDIAVKAACATITKAGVVEYMERNNNPNLQLNRNQRWRKGGVNNQQNDGINIQFIGNQRQTGNKRPKKEKEKSTPKRGYHVINNDTVKLVKDLFTKFLGGNTFNVRFVKDMENNGYITSDMQILEHFNHPLPQTIEYNISKVMVVNTDEHLDSPNANIYGNYRQRLGVAFLEYMMLIYRLRTERPGFTQQQVNGARNALTLLINEMIDNRVFVDQTVLNAWYTQDVDIEFPTLPDSERAAIRTGREQMFNEARVAVEEMLRRLIDRAEDWVTEFMQALQSYYNDLNNRQP